MTGAQEHHSGLRMSLHPSLPVSRQSWRGAEPEQGHPWHQGCHRKALKELGVCWGQFHLWGTWEERGAAKAEFCLDCLFWAQSSPDGSTVTGPLWPPAAPEDTWTLTVGRGFGVLAQAAAL